MSLYKVTISQRYYLDDFENGEVLGQSNEDEMETFEIEGSCDEAVEEGVTRARNYFLSLDDRCDLISSNEISVPCKMAKVVDGEFDKATDEEIELWKEGKFEIWNVEYIIRFMIIELPDLEANISDGIAEELGLQMDM